MPDPTREIVVDTNVVVKFFIEESDSDRADALLESLLVGAIRLVVLDFLFIEFVNVLWLKTRNRELTEEEASEKIKQLVVLSSLVEIVPSTSFLLESFRACRTHDLASYDAAFLTLAEQRDIPFVTADQKLYRKVRSGSAAVVLLRDWLS